MKMQTTFLLGVALLLISEMFGYSARPDADQETAIAEIEKLGGRVTVGNEGDQQPPSPHGASEFCR